jgi:hypothetical protein
MADKKDDEELSCSKVAVASPQLGFERSAQMSWRAPE